MVVLANMPAIGRLHQESLKSGLFTTVLKCPVTFTTLTSFQN